MFLTDFTNSGTTPLLEKTLAFAEARHKVLATNIANITTPGYRTKVLDPHAFQAALRAASAKREASGSDRLELSAKQFRTDGDGFLQVTATEEPAENIQFQDGTNGSIEKQMSQLAENTIVNQATAELLKGNYGELEKSIRGRVI